MKLINKIKDQIVTTTKRISHRAKLIEKFQKKISISNKIAPNLI